MCEEIGVVVIGEDLYWFVDDELGFDVEVV